jgi:undecaprenyl-phosphate 4-deoxy-4-formamido-L-arabinose transferase
MTSFSIVPLQFVTMAGMLISLLSSELVIYMLLRRLFIGPEAEGLFTLMAIQFMLTGITLFSLGLPANMWAGYTEGKQKTEILGEESVRA